MKSLQQTINEAYQINEASTNFSEEMLNKVVSKLKAEFDKYNLLREILVTDMKNRDVALTFEGEVRDYKGLGIYICIKKDSTMRSYVKKELTKHLGKNNFKLYDSFTNRNSMNSELMFFITSN